MVIGANEIFLSKVTMPPWRLLPVPLSAPSPDIGSLLDRTNELLATMPPFNDVFKYLQDCQRLVRPRGVEALRHRLSAFIDAPVVELREVLNFEQDEARLYQEWLGSLSSRLQLADIEDLNARAIGVSGGMRKSPAFLISHDHSTRIPMVSWQEAQQRMTEVPTLWESGSLGSGLLAATRLLALVNNAHAFADGNGRLGRFLFNYCLHRSGMPSSSYIPLKSFAALAHGGYEIRLREIILFSRWDGLISYHCNVAHLVHGCREPPIAGAGTKRTIDV